MSNTTIANFSKQEIVASINAVLHVLKNMSYTLNVTIGYNRDNKNQNRRRKQFGYAFELSRKTSQNSKKRFATLDKVLTYATGNHLREIIALDDADDTDDLQKSLYEDYFATDLRTEARLLRIFFANHRIKELLSKITAKKYYDLLTASNRNYEFNADDLSNLIEVVDKEIAEKIIDTMSYYEMCYEVSEDGERIILINKDADTQYTYKTYAEVIEEQKNQVLDDINDLEFTNYYGHWTFYLTYDELCYIGIDEAFIRKLMREEVYDDFFFPDAYPETESVTG